MQLNQGPNQGTNAVILYHTSSEQLRKRYDNNGVRRDVHVSNKDRQLEVFLNYTCSVIYFGLFSWTLERGSLHHINQYESS